MLVQERLNPKSPKPNPKPQLRTPLPTTTTHRFAETKNLDISTWFSENLYKIVAVVLLIATVAELFFLRNVGDTAALLCFEKQAQDVEWNKIAHISDKASKFANFRSERWIVVSVSNYPSESLKNLARIKGWQVLEIRNSRTPSDWSLKGANILSLEMQANLEFRVVDYHPYDSYVRKTVGYLYAIQHGAKIFDADDRGEVVDGDLGKHFNVELVGESARQEVVFQYSHDNPNRTVVNPYVHFGQRSVWPRGMPLENVGEIGHEEFYSEVFGGKQFIQQGISNGLPDVDSVFYFTRKSGLEAFDIRFDEHAPKVVLPVSVSSMASDALTGY